jgi:C4-dicarboxylate-specific signal transduction histidine kinase
VEDPKEAKNLFLAVFNANSGELNELLTQLRRPNEGRLRQVVANAIRNHSEKQRVVPELLRWRVVETDEFARRAIEAALADVDIRAAPETQSRQDALAPGQLADVYRYVSSRLRHRLSNTMLSAQTQANRLARLLATEPTSDVQSVIAKLNDAMVLLGRVLEATDVDPEYFRQRSVVLPDWLERLNTRYVATFRPIALRMINADVGRCRVFASDYFLETIFWNIWLNAQQAVEDNNCEITIEFRQQGAELELFIHDNGDGFPSELKDVLFQQVYSTKDPGRGRGMLEIQDAVERLGGLVELYMVRADEYRVRIRLPLDIE